MKRDDSSYGSVGRKYDEYVDLVASRPAPPPTALPPQLPYTPEPDRGAMSRTVQSAIGFGIGALLLLLAILSFVTATKWAGLQRDGAAVGYTLTGVFLTISALGGILATWNHNFRVLVADRRHSHH